MKIVTVGSKMIKLIAALMFQAKEMCKSDNEGERILGTLLLMKMNACEANESALQEARELLTGLKTAGEEFERHWMQITGE